MESKETEIQQLREQVQRLKSERSLRQFVDTVPPSPPTPLEQPAATATEPPMSPLSTMPASPVPPAPRALIGEMPVIRFNGGNWMYAQPDWLVRCPKLVEPVIFRSYEKFCKFIMPILNGESMRWSHDLDCCQELGDFIEEIESYGITLTPKQVQDISDNSGFTFLINKVLNHISASESSCFRRGGYRKRFSAFSNQWDSYVQLLANKYADERIGKLTSEVISNTLVGKDIFSLNDLNIRYKNTVYMYFKWFDEFVIRNKRATFEERVLDLAISIDQTSISDISNIAQIVSNLLSNISGSTVEKSVILGKVNALTSVVSLCKGILPEAPKSTA